MSGDFDKKKQEIFPLGYSHIGELNFLIEMNYQIILIVLSIHTQLKSCPKSEYWKSNLLIRLLQKSLLKLFSRLFFWSKVGPKVRFNHR